MDIYHFPVDMHSQPAAIYQGRQREKEGVAAGKMERDSGKKEMHCFDGNTFEDSV